MLITATYLGVILVIDYSLTNPLESDNSVGGSPDRRKKAVSVSSDDNEENSYAVCFLCA